MDSCAVKNMQVKQVFIIKRGKVAKTFWKNMSEIIPRKF